MPAVLRYKRPVSPGAKLFGLLLCALSATPHLSAQQILGANTGTAKDASGAAVGDVNVRARNGATNLEVRARPQGNGNYLLPNLPIGRFDLTFAKQGF